MARQRANTSSDIGVPSLSIWNMPCSSSFTLTGMSATSVMSMSSMTERSVAPMEVRSTLVTRGSPLSTTTFT